MLGHQLGQRNVCMKPVDQLALSLSLSPDGGKEERKELKSVINAAALGDICVATLSACQNVRGILLDYKASDTERLPDIRQTLMSHIHSVWRKEPEPKRLKILLNHVSKRISYLMESHEGVTDMFQSVRDGLRHLSELIGGVLNDCTQIKSVLTTDGIRHRPQEWKSPVIEDSFLPEELGSEIIDLASSVLPGGEGGDDEARVSTLATSFKPAYVPLRLVHQTWDALFRLCAASIYASLDSTIVTVTDHREEDDCVSVE
jgi:hypothetical protein